jgi:hypothetical protein
MYPKRAIRPDSNRSTQEAQASAYNIKQTEKCIRGSVIVEETNSACGFGWV